MTLGYRRSDLQALAGTRHEDARLLLREKRWSSAYYLSGYAIELGLKACIARQIQQETLPERRFIEDVYRYGHELERLMRFAGLRAELDARVAADPDFSANWALVREWSPDVRYRSVDEYTSQTMSNAVGDPNTGVFPWIQTYW